MTKQFVSGVFFAVGMALFGKSMYELGVQKAQEDEARHWKVFQDLMRNLEKNQKKEES